MTHAQRRVAHDVAVAISGAALIVGRQGPPRGLPPDATTITVSEAIDVAQAGYARIADIRNGHYVAIITTAGLAALSAPLLSRGEASQP